MVTGWKNYNIQCVQGYQSFKNGTLLKDVIPIEFLKGQCHSREVLKHNVYKI